MFVKLPEHLEMIDPRAFHFDPSDVPTATLDGGKARILVGRVAGVESPIPAYGGITMAHLQVDTRVVLDVPSGFQAFGVVLRGQGRVNGEEVNVHEAFTIARSELVIEGNGLHVLVAWSEVMVGEAVFQGSFCMFRPERLAQAAADFAAGKMGSLAPSPVQWTR